MILGGIIGLLGSFIPEAIKIAKDWMDRKHELQMLELQIKYARELSEIRIAEERALAEIELDKEAYKNVGITDVKLTGWKIVDLLQVLGNLLNQSVRPILTYVICGSWLTMKFIVLQQAGGINALPQVWTEMDSDFVALIVTYWFGQRGLLRSIMKIK